MPADTMTHKRLDAPLNDEEAYSLIDCLFTDEAFLSVAQETAGNHGCPVNLDAFSDNFTAIMTRWAERSPFNE